ncbi:MAG: hypothetical protein KDC92_10415, partial [Bacteroidetes bacterium]|nr:hypothetical protein [Bacteroidota bacterium]
MADNLFSRFIYKHQHGVRRSLKVVSFFVSLLSLGMLAIYYGFPQNESTDKLFVSAFEWIFSFYVISFSLRLIFNLQRIEFIKHNWIEGILMVLLIYDVVSLFFFGVPILQNTFEGLGVENFTPVYILFIQIYLLFFVGIDAVKLSSYITRFKIKTPAVFGLS